MPICFHAIFHDEIKKTNALILAKNDLKASYIAVSYTHLDVYKRQAVILPDEETSATALLFDDQRTVWDFP